MIPTALFIAAALISSPDGVLGDFDGSRFAWYSSDAANKFENALPIGNGRLGAMVFGGNTEKVVLNENSMWRGHGKTESTRTQEVPSTISGRSSWLGALPRLVNQPSRIWQGTQHHREHINP